MDSSEKIFKILDALDAGDISTQRQLAEQSGVSVGHVNHHLKSLVENGVVRSSNSRRKGSTKRPAYLLTPKGFQIRSRLAAKFLTKKLEEYQTLKDKLVRKLSAIEEKGHSRIVFVGPEIIREFAGSVLRESGLNMALNQHCQNWMELQQLTPGSFDLVLLLDGSAERMARIAESTGISSDRLMSLW